MSLVRAFFCFSQHEPKWRFAHNWGKSRLQLVVRNDASQVSNALSQKWSQIRGDFFSVIIYFTNLQLFIEIEIYFLGDLVCRQPLPFRDQRSTSSLRRSVSNLKGSIAFSPKEKSKAHLRTRRNLPSVEWTSWPISPLRTSHRATQAQWTSARWTTTQGPTCDPKTSFNESSFKMPVVGSGQAGVGQKFFNRLEIFSDSKMAQGCSDRGPQNCNDLHRQIGGEDLKSFRNNTICSNNAMNFKQIPNTQIKAAAQSNPQASRKQYLKNFFCCKWWGSQFWFWWTIENLNGLVRTN